MAHYKMKAEPGVMGVKGTLLGQPIVEEKQVKIGRDKDDVVVEIDGKCMRLPYIAAHNVAQYMIKVAVQIHQEKQALLNLKG